MGEEQATYDAAVAKLEAALSNPDGSLRAIERVEFERLPGGKIRWNLFAEGQRIHSACGEPAELTGWLMASRVLLETAVLQEDQDAPTAEGN